MDYSLKPQQIEFIGAPERFAAYIGGIGTGKSFALIAKALQHSKESPNNLGVIVRKNFTDLRSSTIKDFESYTNIKVNEQTHEAKLPNGSVILFMHGDVLESLKNINAGFIGLEQADDFGDASAWEMLIQRLRRKVAFRTGFLVANANGHNWVWDRFVKEQRPDHFCVQATTYDFADILPPDYVESLKGNLSARMFRRYVMNSHEIAEGLVFEEYNESLHVVEPFEIPDSWEKGFVLDHGFRNPTGVLWYAIDFDGNVVLYDEHYEREKPVSHHAEMIKLRNLTEGLADPSIFAATQQKRDYVYSIADEYRELGINLAPSLREAEQGAIARVNEFWKAGRIKVFRTLTNARHEFGSCKWKPVRPGADPLNLPETVQDFDNHLVDCLKYLIVSRFSKSEKPAPRAEKESLASYETFMQRQREKQQNGRGIW